MADVFTADGQPIEVPDDQVQDLYLRRQIGFGKGSRIPVSHGEHFGTVPAEALHDAFAKGWKFDPAGVGDARDQARYGGPGQQAIAGAEGLLSGATAGISEPIETGLGLTTPEAIAGRKRADPVTSGVGNVVGAVAPAFLGAPEGLAADAPAAIEGASGFLDAARGAMGFTPSSMIARAGGAVEAGVGKGALGSIARGAAETGIYGATGEASRQLLEGDDADVATRAQKVVSAAGIDALFGGGVSGLFHLAGAVSSGAIGKALDAFAPEGAAKGINRGSIESAVDAVTEKAEADPTTFKDKLLDALAGGKDRRAAMGRLWSPEARNLARTTEADANQQIIGAGDAIQELVDSVSGAAKTISRTVKPAEVAEGIAKVDPVTVREKTFDLAMSMLERVEQMRRAPADYFDSAKIQQLELQANKLYTAVGATRGMSPVLDSAGLPMLDDAGNVLSQQVHHLTEAKIPPAQDVWDTLNQVKRNLEKISRIGEAIPDTEKPAAGAAGDFRKAIQGILQDETVFGPAAAANARRNAVLSDFYDKAEAFLQTRAFGERDGYRGGEPSYKVNRGSVDQFFKNLGDPGNETRRQAFVEFVGSARQLSDSYEADKGLQQALSSTYGKTEDAAKLARAMADLKKVKGKATAVEAVLGSPIGRAVLGGFVGGAPGALALTAAGPVGSAVFHLLDQVVARNSAEIRSLAKTVASAVRPVVGRAPVAALKILQATSFTDQTPKPTRSNREAFRRVASEVQALASDPARAQALMTAKVAPIAKDAPKHAQAMVAQGVRSIAYLASILPPAPQRSPLSPTASKMAPSDSAIADFAEAVKVVSNPTTALEDLAHGRISMVGAKALRATNPEIFAEMQTEVMKAIQERGKDLPYRNRQQIALFFGAPLDPALDPKMIAGFQASYGPPPPDTQNQNPTLRSSRELKSIKNAASAMQRLEAKDA